MSRGPVIEQQQPRHVEAQEHQNGQQDGLGAQHGQSASKGQDPDQDINDDRSDVRGEAQLIGADGCWFSGTCGAGPTADREASDRGQTTAPPSATIANDTRQNAESWGSTRATTRNASQSGRNRVPIAAMIGQKSRQR
jgi:hypothetical protein